MLAKTFVSSVALGLALLANPVFAADNPLAPAYNTAQRDIVIMAITSQLRSSGEHGETLGR